MNPIIKKEDDHVKTIKEVMKEAIDSIGDILLPQNAFNAIFDEAASFEGIKICSEHDLEIDSTEGCPECNQEAESQARDDNRAYWQAKGAL